MLKKSFVLLALFATVGCAQQDAEQSVSVLDSAVVSVPDSAAPATGAKMAVVANTAVVANSTVVIKVPGMT